MAIGVAVEAARSMPSPCVQMTVDAALVVMLALADAPDTLSRVGAVANAARGALPNFTAIKLCCTQRHQHHDSQGDDSCQGGLA